MEKLNTNFCKIQAVACLLRLSQVDPAGFLEQINLFLASYIAQFFNQENSFLLKKSKAIQERRLDISKLFGDDLDANKVQMIKNHFDDFETEIQNYSMGLEKL